MRAVTVRPWKPVRVDEPRTRVPGGGSGRTFFRALGQAREAGTPGLHASGAARLAVRSQNETQPQPGEQQDPVRRGAELMGMNPDGNYGRAWQVFLTLIAEAGKPLSEMTDAERSAFWLKYVRTYNTLYGIRGRWWGVGT